MTNQCPKHQAPSYIRCSTNVNSLSPPSFLRNTFFLIIDLSECCYLSFLITLQVIPTTLRIKFKLFSMALLWSLVPCYIPHSLATVTSFWYYLLLSTYLRHSSKCTLAVTYLCAFLIPTFNFCAPVAPVTSSVIALTTLCWIFSVSPTRL